MSSTIELGIGDQELLNILKDGSASYGKIMLDMLSEGFAAYNVDERLIELEEQGFIKNEGLDFGLTPQGIEILKNIVRE